MNSSIRGSLYPRCRKACHSEIHNIRKAQSKRQTQPPNTAEVLQNHFNTNQKLRILQPPISTPPSHYLIAPYHPRRSPSDLVRPSSASALRWKIQQQKNSPRLPSPTLDCRSPAQKMACDDAAHGVVSWPIHIICISACIRTIALFLAVDHTLL
ncbi:hypothetical protein B0J11DRAFT_156422 [Dendryphion nanum]|uniref:Uncharacterized protein n=1 Tax=Dendryphion nanum TaxID=256645 RepID=A0A9P9ITX1_9PLEO|nr:hypothetical protein B0J11DRAFT_156422 [Dendryphion nanum]